MTIVSGSADRPDLTPAASTAIVGLLADISRELSGAERMGGALQIICDLVLERLSGATTVSVTTLRNGQFETAAATDDVAREADELQYRVGSGPCLDAAVTESTYRPADMRSDQRWPEFGRALVDQFGFESMLSLRLALDFDDIIASLNIYGERKHAFSAEDEITAAVIAIHGGLAVDAALSRRKVDDLRRAVESNRDIGVAVGIVMTQISVDRDQAFAVLRVVSQRSNRKLAAVAEQLVTEGKIDLPSAASS